MNLKYVLLLAITLFLAVSSHNVYAVNSIDWTTNGLVEIPCEDNSIPCVRINSGNILDSTFSVLVNASDEGEFVTNGIIDTIDVIVTSVADPNIETYTLTETGPNDGMFTGINFVFLKGNYKFQPIDIVNLTYTVDPQSECGNDNKITQLDSRIGTSDNGIRVYSDSDLAGVGLVLTETGENTCIFLGQLKFTTTGTTDENTGTLQVSQGDLMTFLDNFGGVYYNAQIVPAIAGKGSIIADFDDPDDRNTAEVTVTYNGLSRGLDLQDDGSGSGSGGPLTRPGLVLNFLATLLGGDNSSTPPTLGLDENQRRIVDGGFSFNYNPVDVQQYYTAYPLITTPVGQNNTITLKIYEDKGPDNITHVGLSYGLGKGESFNEGRATIEYDKTFDGKESVTLFDPEHVLGGVNVTSTTTQCSIHNNAQCLEVTFDHIFRESLEYNMVATNIWDFERNSWQNYFNHGIQIVGNSMNPPAEYLGIYRGHPYHLTETGKNTAVDDDGNNWTFDKIWNHDYTRPVIVDNDILNPKKIKAIEQLGFQYSDGQEIFGFDRVDHRFTDTKNQQQIKAQNVMNKICKECQKEPFEKINNIFSYDMPTRYSKLNNPETVNLINQEKQKAQEFLKKYFEKIYPGRIDD